jgi:hypothetical protein
MNGSVLNPLYQTNLVSQNIDNKSLKVKYPLNKTEFYRESCVYTGNESFHLYLNGNRQSNGYIQSLIFDKLEKNYQIMIRFNEKDTQSKNALFNYFRECTNYPFDSCGFNALEMKVDDRTLFVSALDFLINSNEIDENCRVGIWLLKQRIEKQNPRGTLSSAYPLNKTSFQIQGFRNSIFPMGDTHCFLNMSSETTDNGGIQQLVFDKLRNKYKISILFNKEDIQSKWNLLNYFKNNTDYPFVPSHSNSAVLVMKVKDKPDLFVSTMDFLINSNQLDEDCKTKVALLKGEIMKNDPGLEKDHCSRS